MKQLEFVVSPPAFDGSPYLTLTHVIVGGTFRIGHDLTHDPDMIYVHHHTKFGSSYIRFFKFFTNTKVKMNRLIGLQISGSVYLKADIKCKYWFTEPLPDTGQL